MFGIIFYNYIIRKKDGKYTTIYQYKKIILN